MISVEDLRLLEKLSAESGVSDTMLMERAGKALFDTLDKHYELEKKTAVVFAGSGNNAGDGFVLARHLSKKCFVFVLSYGDESKFSGATASAFAKLAGNDRVSVLEPDTLDRQTFERIRKTDDLLLIDALFGIGFYGEMPIEYTKAVDLFNSWKAKKVSLDIPSGIDARSGEHAAFVCKPDLTLTLYDKKPGLMGIKHVQVVPLAFAPEAVQRLKQEQAQRGPLGKSF